MLPVFRPDKNVMAIILLRQHARQRPRPARRGEDCRVELSRSAFSRVKMVAPIIEMTGLKMEEMGYILCLAKVM